MKNILKEIKISFAVFLIESLSSSGKLNETFDEIQDIRQIISEFPNQKDYLFRLCYNTGVKLIKKEQYDNAIVILETILSIMDDSMNIDTRKILAYVYNQHNPERNWKKCLDALRPIPQQNLQPNYLIYMIQAAILSGNAKIVKETLSINNFNNAHMEVIVKINQDLQSHQYGNLSLEFLRKAREVRSPAYEKLFVMNLELKLLFENNAFEKAQDLIQCSIELIKTRQNEEFLDTIQGICSVISKHALVTFNSKCFADSLEWYTKCSRILEASVKSCDASALRYIRQRICLCHVKLSALDSAKRVLAVLDPKSDSKDPFDLYLTLQVAIAVEDEEMAYMALSNLGEENVSSILLKTCKAIFNTRNKRFLSLVLKTVLQKSNDRQDANVCAKVAQCLVRNHLEEADDEESLEKIIAYCEIGLESYENCRDPDLGDWFRRVAWNLAQSPGASPLLRFRLCSLCSEGGALLGAAAGVAAVKERPTRGDRETLARQVLSFIEQRRRLQPPHNRPLLALYEFEARLLAGDCSAPLALSDLAQSPDADARTLENAAALAYEHDPVRNQGLARAALKAAVQRALKQGSGEEVQRLQRSLLHVLFHTLETGSGGPEVEAEALEVCEKISADDIDHFTHMEALWLLGKCWNLGILGLASGSDPGRACHWCRIALGFSRARPELDRIHGRDLASLYEAHFGKDESAAPLTAD
ncbi:hypothetical protein JTE90_003478 [Oedothorax gibbosus]|uniref:Protein ZIP4 homolog n=1 Tax=Oedothorax gibbosus TaxID=931172 RepID=A0AAV6UFN4_9ARAC|nr:hypothetical protein JTE90_003478 [Oedothorax gibbosus]